MAPLLVRIASDLSGCWKQLVVTDLVCKAITFALLTPLLGVLFRVMLAMSGNAVVTDQDILYFLLGPVGWGCAVLAGGIWLAIVALEQAALLGILAAERQPGRLGVTGALQFAGSHALPVIKVTIRVVALTLLPVTFFLAAIGLIYAWMLGNHDINFYLREKPPVFFAAVACAVLSAAVLIGVLLRLFSGWFLALPILLFEQAPPRDALQVSNNRVRGRRRLVLYVIMLWLGVSALSSALVSGIVVAGGKVVVPMVAEHLTWLLLVLGAMILVWVALGLIANFLSTILFASMQFAIYEHTGGETHVAGSSDSGNGPRTAWLSLTMPRLVALSLTAAVLSGLLGVLLMRTLRVDNDIAVIAHRGASARAPENTLASIELAIEEGADWVEIDVQETSDGQVAVFHDSDFMKLAGNPLKIWDATTADLQAIDIGSSFSPKFRNERAPLLRDVLELCKSRAKLLIELKYYGQDEQLEQRVLDVVAEHEMESQVKYMSLKLPAVRKLKTLDPQAEAGILMSVAAGDIKSFPAEFWAINALFANRKTIGEAHRNDRLVYVWTVNDPLTMCRMIGRGVDGLITDDPALARSVIRQRSQLSPVERLLLELADLFGFEHEAFPQ